MAYVKGSNRNEYRVTCLEEMIGEEDRVRVIDEIVDRIDVKKLGYQGRERKNNAGRPEYDIYTMLKLYIYGYQKGIRSGRKLEEACKTNIKFKWLLEEKEPDANTINDFRKENIEIIKKVFYEVNRMYIEMGYLKLKDNSQDGFKIKASNSKEKNYTINKLTDRIKREKKSIEEKEKEKEALEESKKEIEKYLEELGQNEEKENLEEELEKLKKEIEEGKEELKEIEERKKRHEELIKEMKEQGKSQISLTDKESKLMKNNGKFEMAYNTQTTVDMESHITVAYEVDDNPADIGSMGSLMRKVKEEYAEEIEKEGIILTNTTDKGYQSIEDMTECICEGVIPQVTPRKKTTKEVEIEVEYEETEITEEMKKSKKSEDIKKCMRSGIIPECYEGVIEKVKIEEKEIRKEEEKEEEETRSSEEIREEAIQKQTFEKDRNQNVVYCPGGEALGQKSKRKDGGIKYCNKIACKNCKNPCTISKVKEVIMGRNQKTIVPRGNTAEKPRRERRRKEKVKVVKYALKIDEKLIEKRMQTSEHSQGTMKTVDNHSSFLMRGKKKVSGEIALYFIASNIRRVCNMATEKEILKKLKETFPEKRNTLMA